MTNLWYSYLGLWSGGLRQLFAALASAYGFVYHGLFGVILLALALLPFFAAYYFYLLAVEKSRRRR